MSGRAAEYMTFHQQVIRSVEAFVAIPDDSIVLTCYGDPIRMSYLYREVDDKTNWPASALPASVIGRVDSAGEPS